MRKYECGMMIKCEIKIVQTVESIERNRVEGVQTVVRQIT